MAIDPVHSVFRGITVIYVMKSISIRALMNLIIISTVIMTLMVVVMIVMMSGC